MKGAVYRKKGLRIVSYWFDLPVNDPVKCDIISYHDLEQPIIGAGKNIITRKAQTLVNELEAPIDELFSKVQSDTRNKIRRAEKEGIVTKFYSSEDILRQPEVLDEFMEAYNQFIISKNLRGMCTKNQLEAYCKSNMLYLFVAAYQGCNIVFHIYVGNGQITRGIYSASLFRNENESYKKNLHGNANKLLHWRGMCKFKELGYKLYDWGGHSKLNELQSINRFKEAFGGEIKDRYHYVIPNSLLGSLTILAMRFIKKASMLLRKEIK